MSLPQIANLEFDVSTDEQTSTTATTTVHSTFDWDFETDDFKLKDGKLIELTGIKYIKVWAKKALLTVKNTLIYADGNYGSEHYSMIGSTFHAGYKQAEMERMIQECLLQNNAITSVDNFTFEQDGELLTVSFVVNSIYGTSEVTI
jgi:hypothetical protein